MQTGLSSSSASGPSQITDLRAGGVYLPGILLFHLYSQTNELKYAVIGGVSLVGAVYLHGLYRAVFGPKGAEENPLEGTTTVQRMLVAITGKGPASKFAGTLSGIAKQAYASPQIFSLRILFIGTTGFIFLIGGGIISLVDGWRLLNNSEPIVYLLYLAEIIWVLQWLLWSDFAQAYLLENSPMTNYEMNYTNETE